MKQYTSDTINEISAALAKAQGEIRSAAKGVVNEFFKTKYADLAACVDVAREPLSKNGLAVFQVLDTDESGTVLITHLTHASGQWVRSFYPVRPVKQDPQSMGSAVTYARRYAFCAMVGVVAEGEDDDGNAASSKPEKAEKKVDTVLMAYKGECMGAIERSINIQDLQAVKSTNLARWTAMKNGKQDEVDAYSDIVNAYNAKMTQLKSAPTNVLNDDEIPF